MLKWLGIGGTVAWLAGVAAIVTVLSRGIIREPVRLRLPDGTHIRGTLYRPAAPKGLLPAAVVLHGAALGRQSCVRPWPCPWPGTAT